MSKNVDWYKERVTELERINLALRTENETLKQRLIDLGESPEQTGAMLTLDQSKEMVVVPLGAFEMGSEAYDAHIFEEPVRNVRLSRSFCIGKYPVTQAIWVDLMKENPSEQKSELYPVTNVNWMTCIEFCNKLSEKEGFTKAYEINGEEVQCDFEADGYRLPTEAEWEWAARAKEGHKFSGGANPSDVAWTKENSNQSPQMVGQKKANGFGLHDMSGNIQEWCWDFFGRYVADWSTKALKKILTDLGLSTKGRKADLIQRVSDSGFWDNPNGPEHNQYRMLRGGSWSQESKYARVSSRDKWFHQSKHKGTNIQGLRLVRSIPKGN